MKTIRIALLIVMVFAASIAIAFVANSSKIGEYLALKAYAQALQKPADTKPDPQAEFKVAQKRVVDAQTAALPYQQELESAIAARSAVLFKMMAEDLVKPSECLAPDKDGRPNPFACLKQDPATGAISFQKLVTAKAEAGKPKTNN